MKNLEEIIDYISQRLGEPDGKLVTKKYIEYLVNEGQRELAAETEFFKKSVTLASSANKQLYDLTGPFAAPDESGIELTVQEVSEGEGLDTDSTYSYKFTFYSSYFDIEGEPSGSVTGVLTDLLTGIPYGFLITGIPESSEPTVTHVRIYRTEGYTSLTVGDYKYVGAVANGTTVYADEVADSSLGDVLGTLETKSDFVSDIDVWYDTDYHLRYRKPFPRPEDTGITGTPAQYFIYGGKLGLHPLPDEGSKDILLYYVALPPELSQNQEIPELPRRFHNLLAYYAMWNVYEDNGDENRAALYHGKYFEGAAKLMGYVESTGHPTQVDHYVF